MRPWNYGKKLRDYVSYRDGLYQGKSTQNTILAGVRDLHVNGHQDGVRRLSCPPWPQKRQNQHPQSRQEAAVKRKFPKASFQN